MLEFTRIIWTAKGYFHAMCNTIMANLRTSEVRVIVALYILGSRNFIW